MTALVWALDLTHVATEERVALLERLRKDLSPPEQARLDRFRFADDALRSAAGRALVRRLVVEAQQLPPAAAADVVISTSDGGTKPVLAASCREKFWGVADFNIAHDGCWVLAGVTGRGVIGVDVARIHCPDGMSDHEYIAGFAQQLSDGERAYLARHSTDMLRDFYRVWTAKEAYVKATGTGIVDVDLATIDVSLAPDGQAGVRANGQPVPLELRAGSLDSSHVFCVAAARGVAWALRTIGPSDL